MSPLIRAFCCHLAAIAWCHEYLPAGLLNTRPKVNDVDPHYVCVLHMALILATSWPVLIQLILSTSKDETRRMKRLI